MQRAIGRLLRTGDASTLLNHLDDLREMNSGRLGDIFIVRDGNSLFFMGGDHKAEVQLIDNHYRIISDHLILDSQSGECTTINGNIVNYSSPSIYVNCKYDWRIEKLSSTVKEEETILIDGTEGLLDMTDKLRQSKSIACKSFIKKMDYLISRYNRVPKTTDEKIEEAIRWAVRGVDRKLLSLIEEVSELEDGHRFDKIKFKIDGSKRIFTVFNNGSVKTKKATIVVDIAILEVSIRSVRHYTKKIVV